LNFFPAVLKRYLVFTPDRIISWLFIIFLFILITSNIPFKKNFYLFICSCYLIYQIVNLINSGNRHLAGDLIIRKQQVSKDILYLLFRGLILGCLFLVDVWQYKIICGEIILFSLLRYIVIRIKKPHAIAINKSQLFFNDIRLEKRDIDHLRKIELISYALPEQIQFSFTNDEKILITVGEYNKNEIQELIGMLKERSKQPLSVSNDVDALFS
jgi:hypothetical protein